MAPLRNRHFFSGVFWRHLFLRVRQDVVCAWLEEFSGWTRIAGRATRFWTAQRAADYLARHGGATVLLAPDGREAMRLAIASGTCDRETLLKYGADMRARRFDVLNVSVPQEGVWPWRRDWRNGHVFPLRDFRADSFGGPGPQDVKYPRELSRLWFLQPLAQKALLEEKLSADASHLGEVLAILENWRTENPLGSGINWDPTEAALRGLGLVVLFDLFLLARAPASSVAALLGLMTAHGEFIFRTVGEAEVHDHRFAARIVALLALGSALASWWPAAQKWQLFATERIEEEILTQFLPDGVGFEKSSGGQRLTTELFLIAALLQERRGQPMVGRASQRLAAAAVFMASMTPPGGEPPSWGEGDEARVFALDPASPRSSAPVLGVAAGLFNDGRLKPSEMPAEVPWLLGVEGVRRWQVLSAEDCDGGHFFEDGGVMIARGFGSFLFFNAGCARPESSVQHRHNDLLSFVLHMDGMPLVIDPGTYAVTGHSREIGMFCGMRYHNTLMVDGQEAGSTEAASPLGLFFTEQKGLFQMQAAHDGYRGLADPVTHWREIVFSAQGRRFLCKDKIEAAGAHRVERLLHFAPGVMLEKTDAGWIAVLGESRWRILMDSHADGRSFQGKISPGYGLALDAPALVLANNTDGPTELFIDIFPIAE